MSTAAVYKSRSIKRTRRTRDAIQRLRRDLLEIISRYKPMTVRQVYYQAVSRGLIDKTEAQYKNTIVRLLGDMRRDGELPYDWIADNTRWMRKPRTYSGLTNMLEYSQQTYRRAIWDEQDVYVEVWLEKEALAGVLVDVTAEWDVPLMVTRGYPSISFIHSAAENIAAIGKPTFLYYFGDHDPSGVDISRNVEEQIRKLAGKFGDIADYPWYYSLSEGFGGPEIDFERIAVTPEQIDEYNLPTRPTKKTDSRAKSFKGESVEVDAIEPDELRRLCRACIVQHIDLDTLEQTRTIEEAERDTLRTIVEGLDPAA